LSWLNKQIAKIAPGFALKREVAQRRLNRLENLGNSGRGRRSFDSIAGGRMRYDFLTTSKSADAAIKDDIDSLRKHVRQLEYNNGFVSGPIRRIVNFTVGRGFRLQASVKADEDDYYFPRITEQDAKRVNTTAEREFKLWSKESDRRLIQTFAEQCRVATSSFIRDGEVLVIGRESDRRSRMIPYCLEVLECDRLQTPMEEMNNPSVRNGIRYDNEGVPEAYFLLKTHPGETIITLPNRGQDFEEVPAFFKNGNRKVLHLFDPIRPEQSRGFSELASALKDFQDLDRYREAEIYAALEDACLTGIVTTEQPSDFQNGYTEQSDDENYDRVHDFAPGKWHYFRPGEKVDIHSPKRPNQQFGELVDQLIRGPANSLDVPPEVLSQAWKGLNYSNARTILLLFWFSCWVRQGYLINHLLDPVYDNVMIWFVIRGLVRTPGFDRRKTDYMAHSWIPMVRREWVDPMKEARGKEIDLDNLIETTADIWAAKGEDWEEKLDLIARIEKRKKELEEKHGITFPQKSGGGNERPDDEQKDDEEDENVQPLRAVT